MPLNPYFWLIALIFLAVTGGSSYVAGRMDGKKLERSESQARDNKALIDVQEQLAQSQTNKATIERNSSLAMAAAAETYQKELKNVSTQKNVIIDNLRAGAIRLRDPGTSYTLGADKLPGVGATASGCNGEAGGKLSDATSEFLITEASRADEVTRQLQLCQKIILIDLNSDRKLK